MPLTMHNYVFVSEKTAFYEKFEGIFMLLKNAVIEQVYALWDCIDNRWFDEMEIETIKGLNWIEDLEWGVGIGLKTRSGKCL